MTDDHLHELIRQSGPPLDFPADFQGNVWARIETVEGQSGPGGLKAWWQSLLTWIARPVPAVAVVVAMGICGCVSAWLAGSGSAEAERAYMKAVSPFEAAHIPPPR